MVDLGVQEIKMSRKKGSLNKEHTIDWELIPEDHKCFYCGHDKYTVNFYVTANQYAKTVSSKCNSCKRAGLKGHKVKPKIIGFTRASEPVKYDIKHQIDMYFKEGVYNET